MVAVGFDVSVKVLGYVLSDEEREMKRQWSKENHSRMQELKALARQARRHASEQEARRTSETLRLGRRLTDSPRSHMCSSLSSFVTDVSSSALSRLQSLDKPLALQGSPDTMQVFLRSLLLCP